MHPPPELVRPLRVLYASDASPRVDALQEALRNRGHHVLVVHGTTHTDHGRDLDVLVLDVVEEAPADALARLAGAREAHPDLPVVLVADGVDLPFCLEATALGSAGVVQDRFAPGALAEAVELAHGARPRPTALAPVAEEELAHDRTYHTGHAARAEVVGDLCAFLTDAGVAGPHRARIASAVAELVENVYVHAFPGGPGGVFHLRAGLEGAQVVLELADDGVGIDLEEARLERVLPALPCVAGTRPVPAVFPDRNAAHARGLVRVERLADAVSIGRPRGTAGPTGTRVELGFELTPVTCGTGDDLPVERFLPAVLRPMVESVQARGTELDIEPADLALTVRRLLGGASSVHAALPSR